MRHFYLAQILQLIGGKVVHGNPNPLIKDVAIEVNHTKWKSNTLYFLKKNRKSSKIDPKLQSVVFITDYSIKLKNIPPNTTIVKVKSCKASYWQFIDYYRSMFDIPFIAVTGTCGKTTTKEMLGWILEKDRSVYKTFESANDPTRNLTYLLGIPKHTEAVVMETAVGRIGHLAEGLRYFKPQIGILTTIGIDHLNGFPDLETYKKEKMSIFTGVDPKGVVFINIDDEQIKTINTQVYAPKIMTFGKSEKADYRLKDIQYGNNCMNYILQHGEKMYHFSIAGYGEHNVYNAIAAIAAAHQLGMDIQEAGARMKSYKNLRKHVEIKDGINHSTIIDDTWSTNPTSIKSALEVLKSLSKGKTSVAVLGEIKYLADKSEEMHLQVGEMVANVEVDYLLTVGPDAEAIAKKARELGMDKKRIFVCHDQQEALAILTAQIDEHSVVLVKASMRQSFDQFVKKLTV